MGNFNNDVRLAEKNPIFKEIRLLLRQAKVFYIAARVFVDYKFFQWKISCGTAHDRNAIFLFENFVTLAALWVKLGQYLSSRADIMPKPLSACQDSLPPRFWEED